MTSRSRRLAASCIALAALSAGATFPTTASAAPIYASDDQAPDLLPILGGFDALWTSDGRNDLGGTVLDGATLAHNDEIVTWINNNATPAQRFRALQDSEYDEDGDSYDQSITVGTGLGSVLGPLYIEGRQTGDLPLTSALISSEDGSSGDFVSTGEAKDTFSYPRPFIPSSPTAPPGAATGPGCAPADVNAEDLQAIRLGKPYADADGSLDILPVAPVTDSSGEFSPDPVDLDPEYDGLCRSGGFPSGHTTTAYQAGITLATLLPEFAPEILSRASENGNNRMALGVHSPLDVIGGRMAGEAALATRWSDAGYRAEVLEPARAELITYLEDRCGGTLLECAAQGAAYQADPYGGATMPGGTAQIVTDRESAVAVYRERLGYAFAPTTATRAAAAVPAGAENLLLTTFPTLSDAQRTSVLAQTQIDSGHPLDETAAGDGSWQRLDLAAAMSATVQANADGTTTVLSTGGVATLLPAPADVPALASTGAAPLLPLGAAALIMLVGTAALTIRRRRA